MFLSSLLQFANIPLFTKTPFLTLLSFCESHELLLKNKVQNS